MEAILPVKNDFVFKLVFGNEENQEILTSFLSAVLKIPKEDLLELQIINKELTKRDVLEVNFALPKGKKCAVQILITPLKLGRSQAVYNNSRLMVDRIEFGQGFSYMDQFITINIVGFDSLERESIHSVFGYASVEGDSSNDLASPQIHYLQLPYLKNEALLSSLDQELIDWLRFIDGPTEEVLVELGQKNQEIAKAVQCLEAFSQDEKNRLLYTIRENERTDESLRMTFCRDQGIEQMVIALLDTLPDEVLQEKSGLPLSRIRTLRSNHIQ